jgi:hypothetical protein
MAHSKRVDYTMVLVVIYDLRDVIAECHNGSAVYTV